MKTKKMSKKDIALIILAGLLLLAGWILVFLVRWVFSTWNGLQIEEMIFQLKAPLEGTGDGIILKGVLTLPGEETAAKCCSCLGSLESF